MNTYHQTISFETKGDCDIIDITKRVESILTESGLTAGLCTIFCPGSTGAITSIEYEGGLLKDFPDAMERIAPREGEYEHDKRWGDGNGHAHIRASIVGPSITIPFVKKRLTLGTWQQVIFVDYDNRPRSRNLEILLLGE
ncbi:YjbQ family protein [Candidatus Thorarchaeota archaeon]|nr:MAG: YjbQ family protein [Candidatus Thorarchaeota archaeon]